jgi:hypothetical protein
LQQLRAFAVPAVVALALAIGVVGTQFLSRGAEATGGAILGIPTSECTATSAVVTLNWTPGAGSTSQWIEYSVHDNGFAAGTFSVLAVDPSATSHSVAAIRHDLPNFWRVMSQTAGGVVASETGEFMPCYRPILLMGAVECTTSGSAQVTFRWAPLAAYGGQQLLEYDNNGDFAGSDLIVVGPLAPWEGEHRRAGFQSGVEYYFRIVRVEDNGTRLISQQGYFVPSCAIAGNVAINPNLYASDDWLVAPRLGIDATVNVRDVGYDGSLGVPSGAYDTVRYNFGAFPMLDGRPGGPGTVLVGGHVDYYEVGLAVFAPLRRAQVGDVIEYWDGEIKYTYVVDWVGDIDFYQSLNPYVQQNGGPPSLLLITCNGTFDRTQFGGYNLRRLVHAVLAQ